jgi:hypothetical protein
MQSCRGYVGPRRDALVAESTSWRSHWRHPRLHLRTYASEPVAVTAPMVAEIPEGIGPPRPGSGMGGLAGETLSYTVACIQNLSCAVLMFPLASKYQFNQSSGVVFKVASELCSPC